MKKEDLTSVLKMVLFNEWRPQPSDKASFIISLCGYYGKGAIPEDVQTELNKLSSQQPTLLALETLLKALERSRSKEFRWDPHFDRQHMPNQITMNPTFNIQIGDDESIVAEIEKVRSELRQESADIAKLIGYIGNMAREAGDLKFEENS